MTIIDSKGLESPSPAPSKGNSGLGLVHGNVPGSELLVTKPHAQFSTVENKVRDEATRAIFHKDALVVVSKLEHDVCQ